MIPLSESKTIAAQGGAFLIESRRANEVFTPEDLNDQQRLIAQTAEEFVNQEIVPRLKAIEEKQPGLLRELLRKAAAIGLCATDAPEAYGGLDLDKVSSIIVSEKMARDGAWAATIGAQSGIAILPIVLFGTDEQKARYVPRLASAEWVGAYCLSESESGSDALHCKARAEMSPDGKHYVLNGTKMWTTNGGIADIYIVFAQVNGNQFTAFIVERALAGVAPGAEERKMGIRGSSTTPVVFEGVHVPIENVLGEVGKGHRIAFNILNMGRLKLGAGCIGGSKILMTPAVQWAKERRAFGRPIADFGLIKEKLGRMAARIYAAESMSYRTAAAIDARASGEERGSGANAAGSQQTLAALQEFAVECSILKVMGTECLDRVADETVQIFGGYGFSADYEVERTYRDQRVNRIYEGTNEINRLLIVEMLLKRAMKGELALIPAAQRILNDALEIPAFDAGEPERPLATEAAVVEGAKRVALMIAGGAAQKFGQNLSEEQEVIGALSNMVSGIYAMESALLRAQKAVSQASLSAASLHVDAARSFIQEAADGMEMEAKRALPRIAEGDALRAQMVLLRRFLKHAPVDVIELNRRLADRAVERGGYPFG